MKRKDFLKSLAAITGASVIPSEALAKNNIPKFEDEIICLEDSEFFSQQENQEKSVDLDKPLTAIVIGLGGRGTVYGTYARLNPSEVKVVGVSDIIEGRKKDFGDIHAVPQENRFGDWSEVFERPKFADFVVIATPDLVHFEPCMAALKAGYHVLLEKPVSPSIEECLQIEEMSRKTGKIVAVCHVLRYSPYFKDIKNIIAQGEIGEVTSIQHLEPIERVHMSHSYVRGNWAESSKSTPIIMAKSCHDMDILLFMLGDKVKPKKISAFGSLSHFRGENAPVGSTERCTEGCSVEKSCLYSTNKVYKPGSLWNFVFADNITDALNPLKNNSEVFKKKVKEGLSTSNYGKCVYKLQNDQPDHYVTNIEFENGITCGFNMEAFSGAESGRVTKIFGTKGEIFCDMHEILVFKQGDKTRKFKVNAIKEMGVYAFAGHGGGDFGLMKDFVQAVYQNKPELISSKISLSITSHKMCLAAEESRKTGQIVEIG